MLKSYSELFTKMHNDYSDFCKQTNDAWAKYSSDMLKETIGQVNMLYGYDFSNSESDEEFGFEKYANVPEYQDRTLVTEESDNV